MSDHFLSPFLEPVKNSFKKFTNKHPKLTKWIGWAIFGVIILIAVYSVNKEFKIISFSEKTEKELTIEWLKKNFTDSTFNVLIFPFNDYTEDPNKQIKIEKAINDRLDEYRRKELYATESKTKIKLKFFEEIDPAINSDSLEKIARIYNTDILLFGNIYDEPKTTTINYIILTESDKWKIFGIEGALKGIAFNSLYEFREGPIIKDLDYLTYWLFCNELLFYKNEKALKDTWNSIERIFTEKIFFKSNAFLTAMIGVHFQKNKDNFQAKEFYNLSLKYRPSTQVYNNLGLILEQQSLTDSAEVSYSIAISLDSSNFNAYNNLAALYIDNKKGIVKAEKLLRQALMIRNDYAIAYFNLGLIYDHFLVNKDLAVFYFKKTLKLVPDSLTILRSIGSAYITLDNDSAKYYLLRALSGNKSDYVIFNDLAVLYSDLGDDSTAEKLYFESLQLNPNNPVALNNLSNIYKRKYSNPDTSISYLNRSIKIDKDYFLPYYNLGVIYYEDYKNFKKAKYNFQKSLSLNKYYAQSYEYMGNIYFIYEKQFDSAYVYYIAAIENNSQSAGVHSNLGIILTDHFGDYISAERYFLKAISINPKIAGYYLNYALLLVNHLNNKDRGKENYLEAIRIDSSIRSDYYDKVFNLNE